MLQRLTLAIVVAALHAPDIRAQIGVGSMLETMKVSIEKQKTLALESSPFSAAKALVKAELLRTKAQVPDSYVDELFAGRERMLYPDVQEKYAERKRQQQLRQEGLQQGPSPDPYERYRRIFITEENFTDGAAFIRTHRALLDSMQARYQVDATLLAALVASETWYGEEVGSYRVFDSLYAYNNSDNYVRGILELREELLRRQPK